MRIINQKRNVSIELENYDLMVDENNVVAFERSTLFSDSEKAYNLSKPYLDVLYQTIDETNRKNAQNKNEIIDNQTE